MTGKIYLQVKLKGQIDKEQLVFQNDKNEEFPFVIKDEKDDTIVRILIEQHMDKINMHVKTLAEKKNLDNKEMVYSIHFKEKKYNMMMQKKCLQNIKIKKIIKISLKRY